MVENLAAGQLAGDPHELEQFVHRCSLDEVHHVEPGRRQHHPKVLDVIRPTDDNQAKGEEVGFGLSDRQQPADESRLIGGIVQDQACRQGPTQVAGDLFERRILVDEGDIGQLAGEPRLTSTRRPGQDEVARVGERGQIFVPGN